MKIKRIFAMVLGLAIATTSFAGCSTTSSSDSAEEVLDVVEDVVVESTTEFEENVTELGTEVYPGTDEENAITVNLGLEPPDMNTLLATYGVAFTVIKHTTTNLVSLDENTNVTEGVAESWEISEDGLTYTFYLREGMEWTNGEPVTANDFTFAWEKLITAETAADYAYFGYMFKNAEAFYNGEVGIEEVGFKAIDDYTLEVTLENPTAYALYLFTFGSLAPINEVFYNEVGADNYMLEAEYFCNNGPFVVTEWVHDSYITIEKNENWYRADEVTLEKITFVMITDASTALTAFQAGEVDVIDVSGEQLAIMEGEEYPVSSYAAGASYHILFNTENEYLSNTNLRKAFDLAFSRENFVEYILEDYSLPALSFVSPTVIGYDGVAFSTTLEESVGALKSTTAEVEEAQVYLELALEELGCTVDDISSSVTIACSDDGTYQELATYLQEQFRVNLGIEIQIDIMTAAALSEERSNGNFAMSVGRWGPDYNDPMTFIDMWVTDGGNNSTNWSNEEYDELVALASMETDLELRQSYFIEAEQLIDEECPISSIYWASTSYVTSGKITGGLVRVGFNTNYIFTTVE